MNIERIKLISKSSEHTHYPTRSTEEPWDCAILRNKSKQAREEWDKSMKVKFNEMIKKQKAMGSEKKIVEK